VRSARANGPVRSEDRPAVAPDLLEDVGSCDGRIPDDEAARILVEIRSRRQKAGSDSRVDPLTALPNAVGLIATLAPALALAGDRGRGAALITAQISNAGALVRQRGHPVFELALFRLARILRREAAPPPWRLARTDYGELTLFAASVDRPFAVVVRDHVRDLLKDWGPVLLREGDGWTPRFGLGSRVPGRGRPGPRTGVDAVATHRARELFLSARDGIPA